MLFRHFFAVLAALICLPLAAQIQPDTPATNQDEVVTFMGGFFARYQVNTALDMVNRVPGFILNDGSDRRGFGGAAGNVLINNRRPSTKQDVPSAILSRIAAGLVERIELIRIRVRDIDLQGHTEVVNVVLRDDFPAVVQWEFNVRKNLRKGTTPYASMSLSDRWREIEYNTGFDVRYPRSGDPGETSTFDPNGILTETRSDAEFGDGPDLNGYMNASMWMGNTYVQANSKTGIEYRDNVTTSTRIPQTASGQPRHEIIDTVRRNKFLELGMDAERILRTDLLGRAILLYSLRLEHPDITQQSLNAAGLQTRLQHQDEDRNSTELIARLEFDWTALLDHAVQVDMERALNILDNDQVFTDDTGMGPAVVAIPGTNVRVEEVRWNFLARDTWSLDSFDLEYGIGLERSTITQSGDANLERRFTFLKPRAVLTHTPVKGRQSQLLLEREVAQLDFTDFVSATVFLDENIALGNPNLRPDSTWIAEASHERRFGDVAVIKLTLFHHWIKDVQDVLPLAPTVDVPGNIGDGRRWGLLLENTLPLDWTGLAGARLDIKTRLQDSTVVDPVTGQNRVLSGEGGNGGDVRFFNENRYAFDIDYRQDFEAARVSWGWGLIERAVRTRYRANELDIFNEGFDLSAFVETTRWFGLNIRLDGENLTNNKLTRDRTVFTGNRSLSPVQRRELRHASIGTRLILTVSGSF